MCVRNDEEMWFIKKTPKKRGLYVVEGGERTGSFLVYIQEENIFDSFAFLCMPSPLEIIYLTKQDVHDNLKNSSLVLVNIMPLPVYDVCKANFQFVKKKEI